MGRIEAKRLLLTAINSTPGGHLQGYRAGEFVDACIEAAKDELRAEIKAAAKEAAKEATDVLRYRIEKGAGLLSEAFTALEKHKGGPLV